jgi:hypothetical protein
MVYRKNFGKTGVYVPPNGTIGGQQVRQGIEKGDSRRDFNHDKVIYDTSEDNKNAHGGTDKHLLVPDLARKSPVVRSAQPVDHDNLPFDEGYDDVAELPSLRKRTNKSYHTHLQLATASHVSSISDSVTSRQTRTYCSQDNAALSQMFDMHLPRISPPMTTLLAKSEAIACESLIVNGGSIGARVLRSSSGTQHEEDDSLFDFPDSPRRRGRLGNHSYGYDAKESGSPTQAMKSTMNQRSMDTYEQSPQSVRSMSVSFDKQKDTIQYYEPGEANDNSTIAGRSLNSEYTKSAESEVEDLIKDILMIGSNAPTNPGRRKIKYSPSMKEQVRARQARVVGISAFETRYDSSPNKSNRKGISWGAVETAQMDDKEEKIDDNPILEMWNYVEGGIKSMGYALGLSDNAHEGSGPGGEEEDTREYLTEGDESDGNDIWFKILGTPSPCSTVRLDESATEPSVALSNTLPRSLSLDNDLRVVDLALQAARSMHHLKGLEFDETYDINIGSDIQFTLVDLQTPFGLIFQENQSGCWVTKVLPNGSAIGSGKVRLGDQLAAIEGVSAINMTVDDIAAAVKKKSGVIELTFLRYVGPIRPISKTAEDEGYEVKPTRDVRPSASSLVEPAARQNRLDQLQHQHQYSRKTANTQSKGKRRFRLFGFGRQRK